MVAASQEQGGTPDIRKAQAHPAPQFKGHFDLKHPGNEQGHLTSAWSPPSRTAPRWTQPGKSVPQPATSVPPGDLRAVQTNANVRADANFQSISEHPQCSWSYNSTGHGYKMWPDEANDICAGDQVPEDWDWIDYNDVWRGMQKGEKRPAIDLFLVKQMLEFKDRSAEIRYGQDREANGGGASFFCSESSSKNTL